MVVLDKPATRAPRNWRTEKLPKRQEVATIVVGNHRFDDWESVFVQRRWTEAFPTFRFTAAERDPMPQLWERLQFRPGEECAIYLGDELAITGVILLRQTAYDANSHGVMLQGVGRTWFAARGSIVDKTTNFDGMTFEQVARKVIAPFGVGVKVIGLLNATPFDRLQAEPGETVWNFLERIARPLGIVMGSDHLGNFLLIDWHSSPVSDSLIEGDNILRCQATISIEAKYSDYVMRSQAPGGNQQHGRAAAEMEALVKGTLRYYSPLLTPSEHPVRTLAELQARARSESIWHEGTEIRATITVQGWLTPRGVLWRDGDMVMVKSPMAMLNMAMKIDTATFTQDVNGGTLTTLELVIPWLLKARGDFVLPNPGALGIPLPPPPGGATTDPSPPVTPQSNTVPDPPPETLERNA